MERILVVLFCANWLASSLQEKEGVIDLRAVFDDYLMYARQKLGGKPPSLAVPEFGCKIEEPGSEFQLTLKTSYGGIYFYRELERVGDVGIWESGAEILYFLKLVAPNLVMHFESYVLSGSRFYATGEMNVRFKDLAFILQMETIARPKCRSFVIGIYTSRNATHNVILDDINLHPALFREERKLKQRLSGFFNKLFISRLRYIYTDSLAGALDVVDLCEELLLYPTVDEPLKEEIGENTTDIEQYNYNYVSP